MTPPYEILSDDKIGNVKRSVNVRIQDRISPDDVNAIAEAIHAVDTNSYERTFIGLYLPHQQDLGAGCWATAHSKPDREIQILGMTAERAEEFRACAPEDGQNVIGRWIDDCPNVAFDDRPNVASAITIYESDSNYFMTSGDGGSDGSGGVAFSCSRCCSFSSGCCCPGASGGGDGGGGCSGSFLRFSFDSGPSWNGPRLEHEPNLSGGT